MKKMKIDILQSGSSGNCVILNKIIALDMGVTWNKVSPYIKDLQLVFISHEHSDHFKDSTIKRITLERPAIRFSGGEWLYSKFISSGVLKQNIDVLEADTQYNYGAFQIEPVELFHDVPNFGLKILMNGEKAIYITDTGYIDSIQAKDFELYMVEANHNEEKIKERIVNKQKTGEFIYEYRSSKYHLSKEQAEKWISNNAGPNSKYVFLHQHN